MRPHSSGGVRYVRAALPVSTPNPYSTPNACKPSEEVRKGILMCHTCAKNLQSALSFDSDLSYDFISVLRLNSTSTSGVTKLRTQQESL